MTAGDKVAVVGKDGGKAEVISIAKNSGNIEEYAEDLTFDEGFAQASIGNGVNNALVNIEAPKVKVKADDDGEAFISAYASNEFDLYLSEFKGTLDLTFGSLINNSGVNISAAEDEEGCGGDIFVGGFGGGAAGIEVESFNELYTNNYFDIDLTIQGPIRNFSNLGLNASRDITVMAKYGYSEVELYTDTWNEISGPYSYNLNLIENGPIQNISTTGLTIVLYIIIL